METLPSAGSHNKRASIQSIRETLTTDSNIRRALKENLADAFRGDPETLILEELGLRHGATRVDVVVVNGCLHGFEVKSDQDTLRRLPRQAKVYSEILDYVTLVVGRRHADTAAQIVPEWWGLQVADRHLNGKVTLLETRKALGNPSPDKLAVAKLLWREEALTFLEELGAADGVKSKPRAEIYARLAENVPVDVLRSRVRHQLRFRTDWRSDELRR